MHVDIDFSLPPLKEDSYILAVFKVLLHIVWRLFSLSVLFLAVLILVFYFGFSHLEHYHRPLQDWLSRALQQPISIQTLRGEWEHLTPVLYIGRSQFGHNAKNTEGLAGFTQARLRIDLIQSFIQQRLITQKIVLHGAYFSLQQGDDLGIHWLGFPTPPSSSTVTSTQSHPLLDGFLAQNSIELRDTQVSWHTQNETPVTFHSSEVNLSRQGQGYDLEGLLQLPLEDYAPPLTAGLGLRSQGGEVHFRSAIFWQAGRLHHLKGQLDIRHLQLASSQAELILPHVAADFLWTPLPSKGWQMQVEQFSFSTLEESWPPSQIQILAVPGDNGDLQLQGQVGFLRLDELVPLLSGLSLLSPTLRTALSATRPQAELHTTHFLLSPDDWELRTHFRQASHRAWRHVPGLSNVSGVLSLSPKVGSLTFNSRDVRVNAPKLFAQALHLESLNGTLAWQRWKESIKPAWVLHSTGLQMRNADVDSLTVRGQLKIPAQGSPPIADLHFQAHRVAARQIVRYTPLSAPKTRRWMRGGLLGGRVEKADIHITGPLTKQHLLLQAKGQSGLQGLLHVRDGHIAYAKGWPAVKQVLGELQIDGDSFYIQGQYGRLLQHEVLNAQINLYDLASRNRPHYLTVKGRTRGDASAAIDFVQRSPLKRTVDLSDLAMTGTTRIAVDIRLPLSPGQRRSVQGSIDFTDNRLSNASLEHADLALQHLRGRLNFTDKGVKAEDLHAELLEQAIQLSLHSQSAQAVDAEPAGVHVNLSGQADQRFLHALFSRVAPGIASWTPQISGQTSWQAHIYSPHQSGQAKQLTVTSDLHGMALNIPAPLSKKTDTRRALHFQTPLSPHALGRLRYGEQFNLAYQDKALALHFDRNPVDLKPQAGWQITGSVPRLDAVEWQDFFCAVQLTCAEQAPDSDADTFPRQPFADLQNTLAGKTLFIDLGTEQLLSSGSPRFKQLRVQGYANAQQGFLHLTADEIQGRLGYIQQPPKVTVELNYLHLPASTNAALDSPLSLSTPLNYINAMQRLKRQSVLADPRYLPPLSLQCEDLSIGGIALGQLDLQASPSPEGFVFRHLSLRGKPLNVEATGLWAYHKHSSLSASADAQSTRLDVHLRAHDFAQAMAQLGQQNSAIQGGQMDLHFQGNWPGNPLQFHESHVKGRLHVNIDKGQLIAVELGPVGRLVGLLDLRSLSRRLALDFRDVFEKGFGFNGIKGDFFLEGGHAYTDGIHIKGPIADIDLSGRTGLLNRTYEQDVIVMPHVSNTLPVAGAVAGGPALGLGVLVLQSLFKDSLRDAVRYHYRISGDWDAPNIERISMDNDNEMGEP